jgi:hypothetical protein
LPTIKFIFYKKLFNLSQNPYGLSAPDEGDFIRWGQIKLKLGDWKNEFTLE